MNISAKRAFPAILLAFLMVACSDNDGERRAGAPVPTSTQSAAATATDEPTQTPTAVVPTGPPTGTATDTPMPTATPTEVERGAPVVTTDKGAVRGKTADGVRSFLGIPYAAPPVGDLRWRPPVPHAPWADVRDAVQAGSVCPQKIPLLNTPTGNEDCLFLNVHTPDPPPAELLPVMVWIHGGGFTSGDGLQFTGGTDGSVIVRQSGVVVVSLNYRLGQLGFLAHPALTAEDANHPSSGNYGLEDQTAALRWVQRNIAAFGGDPDNVTIFGESAGGWSVCAHLVSPLSAGLFHRAIVESGLCLQPLSPLAGAEGQGVEVASRLGCAESEDVLACMRAESAGALLEILPPDPAFAFSEGEFGSWMPNLDGYVFAEQMEDSFTTGRFNQVPAIVGSNKDEGTLFVMMSHNSVGRPLTEEDYPDRLRFLLGNEDLVSAVLAQYSLDLFPTPFDALSAAFGDGFLACPTIDAARAMAPYVPTYLYQFEFPDAKFPLPTDVGLGAFHSAEIQYVFGRPSAAPFTADESELSRKIMGYWTRFAATGDPNGGGAVSWPSLDEADRHLLLDRTIRASTGAKAEACAFWRGLDYKRAPLD